MQVESQKGKSVEVFFVDFGNTDKVDSIDVVGLPAELGTLETQARGGHKQTISCSLRGIVKVKSN